MTTRGPYKSIPIAPIELDPLEAAYLAGFIDGEGCFGAHVYRRRKLVSLRFTLTQKHPDYLRWLHSQLGVGKLRRLEKVTRVGHDPTWSWVYVIGAKEELRAFLNLVLPHLKQKKPQATLLLQMIDLPNPVRRKCAKSLRQMKRLKEEG